MHRVMATILACFWLSSSAFAEKPSDKALEDALNAYKDSSLLGHKADSFLHARRAYVIATKLFDDDVAQLAPIAHTYARAAMRYKEPIALPQFQRAISLFTSAYGTDSDRLLPVLADAAEEAIHREEPELAYSWLKKSRELLEEKTSEHGFIRARVHMGLARLYYDSREFERATKHTSRAFGLASQHIDQAIFPDTAQLYFWHGQVMRWLENPQAAEISYNKALAIYNVYEPRARPVLSIHLHMVSVNHELGRAEQAAFHCIEAQKYETARNMELWYPVYDPAGRLSQNRKRSQPQRPKSGQILVSYTRSANCHVSNIKVHKTAGISADEAARLLRQAYIAPRMQNGMLATDQKVDQININVY